LIGSFLVVSVTKDIVDHVVGLKRPDWTKKITYKI